MEEGAVRGRMWFEEGVGLETDDDECAAMIRCML